MTQPSDPLPVPEESRIRVPLRIEETLAGITIGMAALTFLILALLGARMAWDEYRFEVTSPGIGIPTWIYTVWLPILSLVVLGRAVGLIIRIWRSRN